MTTNAPAIDDQIAQQLHELAHAIQGKLDLSSLARTLYATDASAYQETPLAVAFPETENDIGLLIRFANEHRIGLIPRTAGTSLAGQVVGNGIVVDVSRHWCEILEINADQQWVRVQPGVIRDELNHGVGSTRFNVRTRNLDGQPSDGRRDVGEQQLRIQ